MPEGVIEWFDPATGTGRIARGGQRFTISAVDVERAARRAGARVHFDIDRHRPGEALNVTSRPGGRSRPQHHGVGRLTGARHPDAKARASADPFERPLVDRDVHPERVAVAWSRYVAAGDVPAAVALCAPTAVLHTSAGELTGLTRISEAIEAWPYTGTNIEPTDVAGRQEAGTIAMTWPGWGPDRTVVTRVEHGEIADLSIEDGALAEPEPTGELAVELSTAGPVTDEAKQYAVEKVRHVIARVTAPVLFVRVKLRQAADPALDRPAQAEALLDVNGRVVRAHTSQVTMTEAVDELADRLSLRLQHQPHWSRTEGVPPEAGEWRRHNRPSPRAAWFERPPEERQLVRHTTIADEPMTVDEAVFDMDLLDYDFYLFNDLATGQDAVVRRTPDGGLELQVLRPDRMEPPASRTSPVLRAAPPATLTVQEARAWLELSDEPMVFFADSLSGRGSVLYRRYDGHYGIVRTGG